MGDDRAVAERLDDEARVLGLPRERDVPAAVGREAPHRLARDQLALGDLRRGERDDELVALHAGDVGRVAGQARLDLDRVDVLGTRDRLQLGGLERLLEAAQGVAQLPVAEHRAQVRAVRRAGELGLEVDVDRDVADHRRQLLGHARVVGVLGQVLLALCARDLVDAGQHAFEVAELLQQVGRGLVADAGDAGDVVRRVALEADEVRDELGRDAVALDHRVAVVDLRVGHASGRGHDPDAVVHELVGVAVAGDDHHGDAALLGLLGQGGDHVVGLEAFDGDVPVAERFDQGAQVRPLQLEQVGPGRSLRLVVGADVLAAGHAGVPDHDRRHLAVVGEDLHEHRREAEDRVRRASVRGRDRLWKREERAVRQRVPVDQEQLARCVSVALSHAVNVSGRQATNECWVGGRLPLCWRRGFPVLCRARTPRPRAPSTSVERGALTSQQPEVQHHDRDALPRGQDRDRHDA